MSPAQLDRLGAIGHANRRNIMKRILSMLALALLASSLASAGYVKIHNRGSWEISVDSFNSNDYANEFPYEAGQLAPGETREFN